MLASLDETTYTPGTGAMGSEHPIAWCQDYDGGRSWYTGMGHTEASFTDAKFLDHILGGIQTAAGVVDADCKATLTPSFEKVALDENTSNPMELTIADDGPGVPEDDAERIFERFARHDPDRSRNAGGTGLGLAISREIVTGHGGTIALEPGPGAQFTIRLPVSSAVG